MKMPTRNYQPDELTRARQQLLNCVFPDVIEVGVRSGPHQESHREGAQRIRRALRQSERLAMAQYQWGQKSTWG